MDLTLTATANAGVILDLSGKRFWIDALHTENRGHYSVITPEMMPRIFGDPALRDPDYLLYTHAHQDHFSEETAKKALAAFPDAKLFIGGDRGIPGQHLLSEEEESFREDGVTLRFLHLPHDGKDHPAYPNYAILIETENAVVLDPGDCPVACPTLLQWLKARENAGERPVDLYLLNFPWLSIRRGRAALSEMHAEHVLFFHLPFPEDDVWGYGVQAEKALRDHAEGRDWRLVREPFQEEHFQ